MVSAGYTRAKNMQAVPAISGDMAARLHRVAIAADRRAASLPANTSERALHTAQCELALARLAQLHSREHG
jgi:CRISPR/Cas system-associated protein Cas7 (RAMP superfamily)